MAKKATIDLSHEKLSFEDNGRIIKLISFNPDKMTLTCTQTYKDEKSTPLEFPFSHLPKSLKKALKPLT